MHHTSFLSGTKWDWDNWGPMFDKDELDEGQRTALVFGSPSTGQFSGTLANVRMKYFCQFDIKSR